MNFNSTIKPDSAAVLLIVALALGGLAHRMMMTHQDAATTKEGNVIPHRQMPHQSSRATSHRTGNPKRNASLTDFAGDNEEFRRAKAVAMAKGSTDQAAAWVETLPQEQRTDAIRTLCDSMAYRDPAAAAEWLGNGRLPRAAINRCLPFVMNFWLASDRSAALDFIKARPPDGMKGRLMLEASQILTDGDRDSALAYALTMPNPAMRGGAFVRILEAEFNETKGKGEAHQWIAGISDSGIRDEILAVAQKRWPEPHSEEPAPANGNSPSAIGGNVDPFAQ